MLSRFHSSATMALLPIYGAVLMGSPSTLHLSILFFIGVLGYCGGCALNAYADVEVDKFSRIESIGYKNPLVFGLLSKREALGVCLVSLVVIVASALLFFPSILPLLTIGIAIFFGFMYNLFSKKAAGMEIFSSISYATFFLFGAASISANITFPLVILFLVIFAQNMFEFSILGGLKDCDHDLLVGRTTASQMGVRMTNGIIKIPKKFKIYALGLWAFYISLIILWFIVLRTSYSYSHWNTLSEILVAFLLVILTYSTGKLISNPSIQKLRKAIFIQIPLSYCVIIPAILFPVIGAYVILFAIIPIIWFISFSFLLRFLIKPHRSPPQRKRLGDFQIRSVEG